MRTRLFLIGLLLAAIVFPALAFDRPFPATVKRAVMLRPTYPTVVINGKEYRLSTGAHIWNENNLIEQPDNLRDGRFIVNYTENADGSIDRIWILTKDEIGRPLSKQQSNRPQ